MGLYKLLILFSGVSFISYGIGSFNSKRMRSEYARWGFKNYRYLIGGFQFLGGLGLLIGLCLKDFILFSSIGLTVLMISAICVRIKIGDTLKMTLPAIVYTIINSLILFLTIN